MRKISILDGQNFGIHVEEKIKDVEIKTYSYPDEYIKHGTVDQLEKIYHIDKESIEKEVRGHKYE